MPKCLIISPFSSSDVCELGHSVWAFRDRSSGSDAVARDGEGSVALEVRFTGRGHIVVVLFSHGVVSNLYVLRRGMRQSLGVGIWWLGVCLILKR
jgi:hypothetical protein